MNQDQLISIIIPAYNSQHYLAEAIESVQSQNHNPIEIIVVDDGSTDDTGRIATRFGKAVQYQYQTNRGPAAARNAGLKATRGSIVAFLDADDLWSSNTLELHAGHLMNNPSVDIVLGLSQLLNLHGSAPRFKRPHAPLFLLSLGAAVVRKSVFDTIGGFDETLFYGEDTDWFMRAREQGVPMTIIPNVSLYYRIHTSNMTNDVAKTNSYLAKVMKKSLDRRRKNGTAEVAPIPKFKDLDAIAKYLNNEPENPL